MKRFDYGLLIFILTFTVVVVSGIRDEKVMILARERLSTVTMGILICIFISLFVFPRWASDELHESMASKFEDLAHSIEGCLEEYFGFNYEKENQPTANSRCQSIINPKAKDESLAKFARLEPWHGKFGHSYPWGKYLQIGGHLKEIAATILSLKGTLRCTEQPAITLRQPFKEPCKEVGNVLARTLTELGESVLKMRRCNAGASIVPDLKSKREELNSVMSLSKLNSIENGGFAVATFVFIVLGMLEKVEELAKKVEELGELADFST